jgi:acetyl esterase
MKQNNIMKTLDPDVRHLLALAKEAGYPPFQSLTPAHARSAYAAGWASMQSEGGEVDSVKDVTIESPAGALNVRIYRGEGTHPQEVLPCMMFLHGGGWVIGNLESHDRLCRRLANVARICVVAVDYRLAPEYPFPAALDDSASAWRWLHAHTKELKIHSHAIGVGGDSAGGNLAAALALMGRDAELHAPVFQALIYPAVDLTAQSESYKSVTADVPLTAATMHYFIAHYTPNPVDRRNWRASPLLASSLKGVAPALVMTVAHDPLSDEGRAFAKKLDEAGVRVCAMHVNDQVHGLLGMGKFVPAANHIGDHIFKTIGFELHRCANNSLQSPAK